MMAVKKSSNQLCGAVGLQLVAVAVLVTICSGSPTFFGSCPTPSVVTDFNVTAFAGDWYEARRYFNFLETGYRCITWTFAASGTTGDMTVSTSELKFASTRKTYRATLTEQTSSSNEAKYNYNLNAVEFQPFRNLISFQNYWILDTDYTSYAVAWSCKSLLLNNEQRLWVLTRTTSGNSAAITSALSAITSRNLNTSKLKTVSQSC